VLEVADSGTGLPDGSERIFDPFFSNREQRKGMGLGLSIVHGFVTLWGGQVYATPHHKELGGAGFFVEMRMADGSEGLDAEDEFEPAASVE
jgi:signal transduction histidine kinase